MNLVHWVRRARQVARHSDVTLDDLDWVSSILRRHEMRLFAAAPAVDRAHMVGVARAVEDRVGDDPRWLRAALLHDAGKGRAPFGVVARSAVMLFALAAPVAAARLEEAAVASSDPRFVGPLRRRHWPGAYLGHGPLGAAFLESHGTEQEVCAWVRAHHRQEEWPELPIPANVIRALVECDE